MGETKASSFTTSYTCPKLDYWLSTRNLAGYSDSDEPLMTQFLSRIGVLNPILTDFGIGEYNHKESSVYYVENDEMLFLALMFVMTPNNQFFPATFYYGPSGTSLGGWELEKYQIFPREIRNEFNFSPFDLDKDGLTGLIEAKIFALQKVPVSDFCGIFSHDLGDALMCVHDGVAFLMELGYNYEYGEYEVEIVLDYLGYDFERDKFNFKEMVKKALNK